MTDAINPLIDREIWDAGLDVETLGRERLAEVAEQLST